jgi:hypothetical protein
VKSGRIGILDRIIVQGIPDMSKHQLKAWNDPEWQRKLSKTLTVSRVDEDIPTETQPRVRKPWFIALTQKPELLAKVGGVDGVPAGHTLLLSEDDVVALVRYLLEPQTVVWATNPSATELDGLERVSLQPGMVALLSTTGEVVNGEAHWTPDFFTRQKPIDIRDGVSPRFHTLPWTQERAATSRTARLRRGGRPTTRKVSR